jgi:hypothetical protein
MQTSYNHDVLSTLPADSYPPSQAEKNIVDTLFTKHKDTMDSVYEESKDSILVGILFIVFSIPQLNDIIYKLVPSAQNSIYITIAIKAAAVMVIYWLVRHYYLSRK